MLCGVTPYRAKSKDQLKKMITGQKLKFTAKVDGAWHTTLRIHCCLCEGGQGCTCVLSHGVWALNFCHHDKTNKQQSCSCEIGIACCAGYLTAEAKSLVRALLEKDPAKRLGSGADGSAAVMRHAFFRKINWKWLQQREVGCHPFIYPRH